MKLHLPKALFTALLAACAGCALDAQAGDIISINFMGDKENLSVADAHKDSTLGGVSRDGWQDITCSAGTYVITNQDGENAGQLVLGGTHIGKWHSNVDSDGTLTGVVQKGYIDVRNHNGENHYTIDIANNWLYYDVIFYMAGDKADSGTSFAPMMANGNAYIGGTNVLATDSNKAWSSGQATGCTQFTDANTITITDLTGALTATNVWNGTTSRATLAGMQIVVKDVYHATLNAGTTEVNSAEWVCNGVSTAYENIPTGQKYLSVSANSEGSTLKLTGGETLNALEVESHKVTISADSAVTITNLNIYEGAAIQFDATATVNSLRGVVDVTISQNVDLNITGNHLTKSLILTAANAIKGSGQLVLKDGFTLKLDHGGQYSAVKSNIKVEAGGTLECLKGDSAAGWGAVDQGPNLITLHGSEGNLATMKVNAKQTIGQGISMQGHSQIINLSETQKGQLELFQPASGIGLSASNMGNVIYTDVQIGANTADYSVGIKVENGGELTIYGNVYSNGQHDKGKLTKSGNGKLILAGTSTFNKVFTNAEGITEFTGNTDFKSGISISNGEVILKGALTGTADITATGAGSLKFGAIQSNASITANTSGVVFAGTLAMADGKTLTFGGENQTVTVDATDMSAFSISGGFLDADGQTTANGNGFVSGAYTLVSGGSISGETTLSYGGQNYTINNANRGFGAATDYSIYYLKNNSASVSTVSSFATQNSATVQEYHLAAGTTLNVDAAPAAIKVNGDASLNISEGITLNHSSVTIEQGASATLTGEGEYTISQGTLYEDQGASTSPAGILIGSTWEGQVNLLATGNDNNLSVKWLNFNHYGNENSTIKLKGVKGWLCNASGSNGVEFTSDFIMENTSMAALELTNGCSGDHFIFSGDIKDGANGGNLVKTSSMQQNITFRGNISDWTGKIDIANAGENNGKYTTITYTGDATHIKNNIVTRNADSSATATKAIVRIENENAVTVDGSIKRQNTIEGNFLNLEVATAKGTTFNNEVAVSKITVESGSKATFANTVAANMLDIAGQVNFTASDALSVSSLKVSNVGTLTVEKNSTRGTISTSNATLAGGATVNANLTLNAGATLQMNGVTPGFAVALDGELTLEKSGDSLITLTGTVLDTLAGLQAPGSGEVVLFTGVDSLVLGGQTYSVGPETLNTGSNVKLSDYFSNDREIDFNKYYLAFNATTGDLTAGLIIPEPTTATLSLLALAGLCARRRRK